ncbi:MAG: EamA family transporter [Thalassobaculales bacterium]
MSARDVALAVLVMFLWGINMPLAKLGMAEIPPILMIALRFALTAALLVPFLPVPRGRLREIAALAVTLGCLHFSLMFTGLAGIDAATAAIAIQVQVPFASLIAWAVLGDRVGWRRAFGMALAFGGVVILAGEPATLENWPALVLVIVAALVWSATNLQMKRLSDLNPLVMNGWMALFAVPLLLVSSFLLEEGQVAAIAGAGLAGWGAVAFMAVGTTIAGYGLWADLLSRNPVAQVVSFMLLAPAFGMLGGWLILGEAMTPEKLIGGAVTLAGIAIIVIRRPKLAAAKTAGL